MQYLHSLAQLWTKIATGTELQPDWNDGAPLGTPSSLSKGDKFTQNFVQDSFQLFKQMDGPILILWRIHNYSPMWVINK